MGQTRVNTNILNKLRNWQAGLVIVVIGFATYMSGLHNPFQGDDNGQIVNNIPVHSLANFNQFFEGGTFYYGPSLPLSGDYYRPLMTTTFSLLYTFFGPKTLPFHLLQLVLFISSAFLLYLVFCFPFRKELALFLALIFLVHPINSQNVFAIPSMQDVLFLFFGLLGLYLLFRLKTQRALYCSAVCLFLSLLSKETAILFIAVSLLYLYWYNRKRLVPFSAILVLPLAFYIFLRAHAIGWLTTPAYSPIAKLPLSDRLLSSPEILLFYISKLVDPWKLSTSYFWVQPHFSIEHVLLPLLLDTALFVGVGYAAHRLYRHHHRSQYVSFVFFAIWFIAGMLMLLQIVPLDMTVSETWFAFPMIGLLGMIGSLLSVRKNHLQISRTALLIICTCLVALLSVRTFIRGFDWQSTNKITDANLAESDLNWSSLNLKAANLYSLHQVKEANADAQLSVKLFSTDVNNFTLGYIQEMTGHLDLAEQSFARGLSYQYDPTVDQDLYVRDAILMNWYGNPKQNIQIVLQGLQKFPDNANLWFGLALLYYKSNQVGNATYAIIQAYNLDQSPEIASVYRIIMDEGTLSIAKPG